MKSDTPAEEILATDLPSWREQAVARSLNSARARAEKRVERFLDAAVELMEDRGSTEFTVQEVVERSGQSLRAFYQYFGGKHELMVALFEESVRSTADLLRARVADEEDALERLHCFVIEYHRICRPASKPTTAAKAKKSNKAPSPVPVLAEFAQQLLTARPAEAARVFVPIVNLFEEILVSAADAGVIRPTLDRRRTAGFVLESIMFNAFSATIAGFSVQPNGDAAAEELWDLLFKGLEA